MMFMMRGEQPGIAIIFQGMCKIIKPKETNFYADEVKVFWKNKSREDRHLCLRWEYKNIQEISNNSHIGEDCRKIYILSLQDNIYA